MLSDSSIDTPADNVEHVVIYFAHSLPPLHTMTYGMIQQDLEVSHSLLNFISIIRRSQRLYGSQESSTDTPADNVGRVVIYFAHSLPPFRPMTYIQQDLEVSHSLLNFISIIRRSQRLYGSQESRQDIGRTFRRRRPIPVSALFNLRHPTTIYAAGGNDGG